MPLRISDSCIACGTCVDTCPLGAIVQSGDTYTITDECSECQACVESCPVSAIE